MSGVAPRRRRWLAPGALLAMVALVVLVVAAFRGDLIRYSLDPKTPYQTYKPPPAPDYAQRSAWALMPATEGLAGQPPVDVFFIAPTTFDGGKDWNAHIDDPAADRIFRRVMAPNYAGPFVRVGRIFAPRYRQAGLYSFTTLREDAREARKLAYLDVAQAFRHFRDHENQGRPFLIVGVEQGGSIGARLLREEVAADPAVTARLVGAYLIDAVVPAGDTALPPCVRRAQTGCLAAWTSVQAGETERARVLLARALVWDRLGDLVNLEGPALCFNPILGAVTDQPAPARLHQGAANATGLEWGARPAFMARQVSAHCVEGVLQVSPSKSSSLKPSGTWIERRREPGFNLFYADLETDARTRVAAITP
jgi:hypothetical protein